MSTTSTDNSGKARYTQPTIEPTELDNDISLVLQSYPPTYENENYGDARPDNFNNGMIA